MTKALPPSFYCVGTISSYQVEFIADKNDELLCSIYESPHVLARNNPHLLQKCTPESHLLPRRFQTYRYSHWLGPESLKCGSVSFKVCSKIAPNLSFNRQRLLSMPNRGSLHLSDQFWSNYGDAEQQKITSYLYTHLIRAF